MSEMTEVLWENLKALSKNKSVRYNALIYLQKLKIDSCERLSEFGYATLKGETGPGDAVQIYAITDAGREALAAHEAE